ncbi:hypothetical protein GUJ93_ZPchr0001g31085 [Zizania palustris]|uniref:Uncharacterized protein n=1 Tax=Zizania palustris TaxID=103762 RepID=A0A8J5RRG9_ZIZPA|nr:hypothetical protein GUJ93_ZPchr0001g31085 [Zizania palustris]
MAGLQRSSGTFRRSGSSVMVWEDKHQASGELGGKPGQGDAEAPAARPQRSCSSGHGGYKTGNVQPALDPPSPRVAFCGLCSLFGKDKQAPPRRGASPRACRR